MKLANIGGLVMDRYQYHPFGEPAAASGATPQPFRYAGREGVMTEPNGLYYMRARYYAPQIRRFVNRDVLTGDIANGLSLNRFAYVNGNPVRYIDPSGLKGERAFPGGAPYTSWNPPTAAEQAIEPICPECYLIGMVGLVRSMAAMCRDVA